MRIVVTGSAGFIGSHIAGALAARGDDVLGLDDMSGGDNVPAGVDQRRVDLADEGVNLDRIMREFGPAVLVHCAANAREGESIYSPAKITRANMWAYSRTLKAAVAAGSLHRVVCFSSMAVYGAQPPPFDEDLAVCPADPYGSNKAAMEMITRQIAPVHGFKWSILRPHNVIGPMQRMRDRYRNVAAIFCNRVLRGEPIRVYGDGAQQRAFSAIEDSLPCYLRAVDGLADGEVVNVGGTVPITINALADAVCAEMGASDHPREHLPDRIAEVKHAFSTYAKSQRLLGFEERTGWRAGVASLCAWAKTRGPQPWNDDDPVELPGGHGLPSTWR